MVHVTDKGWEDAYMCENLRQGNLEQGISHTKDQRVIVRRRMKLTVMALLAGVDNDMTSLMLWILLRCV